MRHRPAFAKGQLTSFRTQKLAWYLKIEIDQGRYDLKNKRKVTLL